jgi:hypothetical protein
MASIPPSANYVWFNANSGLGVPDAVVTAEIELTVKRNNYGLPEDFSFNGRPQYNYNSAGATVTLEWSRTVVKKSENTHHSAALLLSRLEKQKAEAIEARNYKILDELDAQIEAIKKEQCHPIPPCEREIEYVFKTFTNCVPTVNGLYVYAESSSLTKPAQPEQPVGTPFMAVGVVVEPKHC